MSHLYTIVDKNLRKIVFKRNRAQLDFDNNKHTRNVILKSRQLGFTTHEAIDSLDDCLFTRNFSDLFIAHTKEDAIEIFDKKVELAWKNFNEELSKLWKVDSSTANKLKFDFGDGNFSQMIVSNSGRSGTHNRVHISEFAKLCAKYPAKADEIITGTIPSVPQDGRIDIESTAEGMGGHFYDIFWEAWTRKREPLATEFKAHFYNWQWDDEDISKIERLIPTAQMEEGEKFKNYQASHNLSDQEITYYYTKWLSLKKDWDKLHQEYPTCVSGNSKIATTTGYVLMKDLVPDGKYILAKYDKGEKQTFTLKTEMGYELVCTKDHPVLTQRGFVKLEDLDINVDTVVLKGSDFSKKLQSIEYKESIVNCKINIDKDLALFLGIFMGDGAFAGDSGTISIACDRECQDVVREVERLMLKLFGGSHSRISGDKKGCEEIRKSNKRFIDIFNQLGILRKNGSGNYRRNIKVPDFIKQSPKPVVKEFLKGLFEADGFAGRNGNRIVFFSKYKYFIQDVQLLLLSFGITSRLRTAVKKSSTGCEYIGYDLSLRKEESSLYKKEIGFISQKKNSRLKKGNGVRLNNLSDKIVSITEKEIERVYDITTTTHDFVADGIVVHNCPDEAFISSGTPYFDNEKLKTYLAIATEPTYIGEIRLVDKIPVFEACDGDLSVWEKPQTYSSYVIGGDTAEGLEGGDYQVLEVIDNKTLKCVAKYRSHVPPDELAKVAFALGKWYNWAYMGIESNKDGLWVNSELFKMAYPNMYYREEMDDIAHTMKRKLGFRTDLRSRDNILVELKSCLNTITDCWTNPDFLRECMTFVRGANGKPEAMQGRHDDEVMATAIAFQIRVNAPREFKIPVEVPQTNLELTRQRIERLYGKRDSQTIKQTDYL